MLDRPRQHHYTFAHRELPAAAFRFGPDLVAAARDGRLTLDAVWTHVGDALPEPDRVAAQGLSGTYHTVSGYPVLLVTLPAPDAPTEAHFVAVVLSTVDGSVRYFTLEDAWSPLDGSRYTVLGEWTADGKHVNYGPGSAPDAEEFLASLGQRLS